MKSVLIFNVRISVRPYWLTIPKEIMEFSTVFV